MRWKGFVATWMRKVGRRTQVKFILRKLHLPYVFFLICTVFTAQSYCKYLCAHCLRLFLIGQEAVWTRYRHIRLRVESYRNTSAPTGHVFSDIDESSLCNPTKELVETFPFVRPSTHSHTLFSWNVFLLHYNFFTIIKNTY